MREDSAAVVGEARRLLGLSASTRVERLLEDSFAPLRDAVRGAAPSRLSPSAFSDYVLSFGEQLSAGLVADLFTDAGLRASAVDARTFVRTDAAFGAARPLDEETFARLRPLARDWGSLVPVVTGFIGETADGRSTTLGRNGSDDTAALLAVGLGAESVTTWTDVPERDDGRPGADQRCVAGSAPNSPGGFRARPARAAHVPPARDAPPLEVGDHAAHPSRGVARAGRHPDLGGEPRGGGAADEHRVDSEAGAHRPRLRRRGTRSSTGRPRPRPARGGGDRTAGRGAVAAGPFADARPSRCGRGARARPARAGICARARVATGRAAAPPPPGHPGDAARRGHGKERRRRGPALPFGGRGRGEGPRHRPGVGQPLHIVCRRFQRGRADGHHRARRAQLLPRSDEPLAARPRRGRLPAACSSCRSSSGP